MQWQEALEILIERTRHERFRVLCGEAHPDHASWREHVLSQASPEASLAFALRDWYAESVWEFQVLYLGATPKKCCPGNS